jgi:hypothetical protein
MTVDKGTLAQEIAALEVEVDRLGSGGSNNARKIQLKKAIAVKRAAILRMN